MARRRLSKSDIKGLNERLAPLGIGIGKKDEIDILDEDGHKTYLVNGEPWLFELEGLLVPHLRMLRSRPGLLRRVTVDMGAVKFVTKGADVMRPGITAIEDGIREGEFVTIVEQTHGKPLAVGKALFASDAMRSATRGKAVTTIYWVGDKCWTTNT